MKGLEERKERIDADVMERYKARCGKCVHVASDGKCPNVALQFWGLCLKKKPNCGHFKRKV